MEIDKEVIQKCVRLFPEGYKDCLAHGMFLLALIVDMGERDMDKPIRISAKIAQFDLTGRTFQVTIEEVGSNSSMP